MDKQKIQEQISKTEDKLKELKLKLGNSQVNNNLLYVKELGIEIEIEVTHKNESYDKIMALPEVKEKLKNGWRLLSTCRKEDNVNEVVFLKRNPTYSKILKMDGSSTNDDFFIEQPFKRNADKGYVAGFYVGRYWSDFDSGGSSWYASGCRGVRFVRKIKRSK